MSSVEDEYKQLKNQLNSARVLIPFMLYPILVTRSEVLRNAADKIANIGIDVSYNIIDVAGSPIIIPNVSAKPPSKPKIEYTGYLSKLKPPYSYTSTDGLDVILPPMFMFDTDKFMSSVKQMGAIPILSLVYGVSDVSAPYNGDFQNAVKKVYYSKHIELEVESTDTDKTPEEHGYPGYPWLKLKTETEELLVRIEYFVKGTKTIIYRLGDSETWIYYTRGRFRLLRIDTGELIDTDMRGRLLYVKTDEWLRVYYDKQTLSEPYAILFIEAPDGLYRTPIVVKPPDTPLQDIEDLLSQTKRLVSLRIIDEYRVEYVVVGEKLPYHYPLISLRR